MTGCSSLPLAGITVIDLATLRTDEDAVVATRNGREVIEKMLGGRVLEVIDENRPR